MMSWLDYCICSSHKKYPRKYPGDLYTWEVDEQERNKKRQHEKFLIDEALSEYWKGKAVE